MSEVISGTVSSVGVLSGTVISGTYIVNDYEITTLKLEHGYALSIKKGSQIQVATVNDGVGIESLEQTETSTEDHGINKIKMELTDGTSKEFIFYNGSKGDPGLSEAERKDIFDAEEARVQAESDRAASEALRVSSETSREANETARLDAERHRAAAETNRVANENTRASNETTRVHEWSEIKSAVNASLSSMDAMYTRAQAVVEEFESVSASADTLSPGVPATATYSNGQFIFGIPRGEKGDQGDVGPAPTVTITPISGGHRITITDATGPHSFDVMDGEGAVQDVQVNGTSVVTDGVADVPLADNSTAGAVMIGDGLVVRNGKTFIHQAPALFIKAGTNQYNPITPYYQHDSTFYGLAKAAGDTTQSASSNAVGTYTESAKSAISQMLNGSVSVSGTAPVIAAMPGIRYVCGEVATLDITLPGSGIVDVVFTSGSTPTVLTVTPPSGMTMKWANGFDPAALEADTMYEINVMDGCLGVAGTWS